MTEPPGDGQEANMMERLKANAVGRARGKLEAGERPEYTGPSIDLEKLRFKDSEAREKKKEREKKRSLDEYMGVYDIFIRTLRISLNQMSKIYSLSTRTFFNI